MSYFRNVATGETVLDSEYRYGYRARVLAEKRETTRLARVAKIEEDRDEVQELIEDLDTMAPRVAQDLAAFDAMLDNEYNTCLEDAVGTTTLADFEDAIQRFDDNFAGTWDSETDYVEDLIEEGCFGETEGPLAQYVDVESLTRDMFISDVYSLKAPGHQVWVFRNC